MTAIQRTATDGSSRHAMAIAIGPLPAQSLPTHLNRLLRTVDQHRSVIDDHPQCPPTTSGDQYLDPRDTDSILGEYTPVLWSRRPRDHWLWAPAKHDATGGVQCLPPRRPLIAASLWPSTSPTPRQAHSIEYRGTDSRCRSVSPPPLLDRLLPCRRSHGGRPKTIRVRPLNHPRPDAGQSVARCRIR